MTELLGKWVVGKAENMDEYMQAFGVNLLLRKVALSITSYEEIKQDGEYWEIHTTSTFRSQHYRFKLGEPFEATTLDGRKVQNTFRIEDGKIICDQKGLVEGEGDTVVTRELVGEELVMTLHSQGKDITAKRFYKRCTE